MRIRALFLVAAIMVFSAVSCWSAATTDQEGQEKEAFYLKTSQDLVELCSLSKDHPLHDKAVAFCFGYVTGAMNFYGAIAASPKVPKIVCSEHEIARSEMVQVFLDWAKVNPQHLAEPPIDGLVRSAMAHWPCPEKNEK
ncbi:MAG: hypothetical protein DSY80_10565 [Desulfocapsa sp.]|nr:MAG: hypothetical protein DSY80_10565 [Desulfocapsa sp.]